MFLFCFLLLVSIEYHTFVSGNIVINKSTLCLMKKLVLLGVFLLGASSIASAKQVPVKTSCGKTVTLESKDYKTSGEMAEAVLAIDKALCP